MFGYSSYYPCLVFALGIGESVVVCDGFGFISAVILLTLFALLVEVVGIVKLAISL